MVPLEESFVIFEWKMGAMGLFALYGKQSLAESLPFVMLGIQIPMRLRLPMPMSLRLASFGLENYSLLMSTVAQIEAAILELPQDSFLELFERLAVRRDAIEYESPELEAELLKAADGPWHPVDDELYEGIRRRWQEKKNATSKTLLPC